jgi:hypothetical protein
MPPARHRRPLSAHDLVFSIPSCHEWRCKLEKPELRHAGAVEMQLSPAHVSNIKNYDTGGVMENHNHS